MNFHAIFNIYQENLKLIQEHINLYNLLLIRFLNNLFEDKYLAYFYYGNAYTTQYLKVTIILIHFNNFNLWGKLIPKKMSISNDI